MPLISELRRRRVFRVAGLYLVAAWVVLQVADVMLSPLGFPAWYMTLLSVLALVGLPISLILGWFYDFTKEGIVRTLPAGREALSEDELSLTFADFGILGLSVVLAAIIGYGAFERLRDGPASLDEVSYINTMPRSVAVLPFVALSGESDTQYFGDGIAEEILNRLAQISALKVIARTSSFAFRGQNIDIRSIAGQLGVRTILEGSVRRAGNEVRVTAQLINADDGTHLWSDNFDRPFTEIFDVQDEIAIAIAAALEIELLEDATRARPTENMAAYEHYLQGRYYVQTLEESSLSTAVEQFEEATKLDPSFAEAWAGAAEARILQYTAGWVYGDQSTDRSVERSTTEREIQPALLEALSLQPDLADALASLGLYQWYFEDELQRAIDNVEHAIRISPNHALSQKYIGAMHLKGTTDRVQGRNDPVTALPYLERAVELDPLDVNANMWLSEAYARTGNMEASLATQVRILELDPGHLQALKNYSFTLYQMGRPDEALPYAIRVTEQTRDDAQAITALVFIYFALDDLNAALPWLEHLRNVAPDNATTFYTWSGYLQLVGEWENLRSLTMAELSKIDLEGELDLFDQGKILSAYSLFMALGDYPAAERMMQLRLKGPFFTTTTEISNLVDMAFLYQQTDRIDDAKRIMSQAYALIEQKSESVARDDFLFWQASLANLNGDKRIAIEHLAALVEMSPRYSYRFLLASPEFQNLHNEPEFVAMIDKSRENMRLIRERAYRNLERQ